MTWLKVLMIFLTIITAGLFAVVWVAIDGDWPWWWAEEVETRAKSRKAREKAERNAIRFVEKMRDDGSVYYIVEECRYHRWDLYLYDSFGRAPKFETLEEAQEAAAEERRREECRRYRKVVGEI